MSDVPAIGADMKPDLNAPAMKQRKLRIGRFFLTLLSVRDFTDEIRAVLRRVDIIKAEYQPWGSGIEYTALCDDFEEQEFGMRDAPYYVAIMKMVEIPEPDGTGRAFKGVFDHWSKV